jgi:hypothetical protein
LLERLTSRIPVPAPPTALKILDEFAGLLIGRTGRIFSVGEAHPDELARHATLQQIVGRALYPIGITNIFCDDPLVVYTDDQGGIFLDGAYGNGVPSHSIEYLAGSIEGALEIMFTPGKKHEPWPVTGKKGEWFYHLPEQ